MTTCVPVQGFVYSALHAGLKKKKRDLALIVAPTSAAVGGVYTTSAVSAAPIQVAREHGASGRTRALIINAGNANACTGERGLKDARAICEATARELGCAAEDVLCASTGVIGVELPVEKITNALPALKEGLSASAQNLEDVAYAIMTTDTMLKHASTEFTVGEKSYVMTGIAKGSGMIAPNMATMIGVVMTDAPLTSEACQALLDAVTPLTFNAMTVDGDTSTNDTLWLLASGAGGGEEITPGSSEAFSAAAEACYNVCHELAAAIASDGEGATKRVDVIVTGARTNKDATVIARTIAESPLVKTALFGNDANWGRVAMAAGRSGVAFNQDALNISFAGIPVCAGGTAVPFDEDVARDALDQPHINIHVDLGSSTPQEDARSTFSRTPALGAARIMTCDLSYEYVRINGEYRS